MSLWELAEVFEYPLGRLLSAIFAALDPREMYSVALLELDGDLPSGSAEHIVSAHRGACHRIGDSAVMAVFGGMPGDAVRCAVALADEVDAHGGTVRGAIHRGLMWDRVSDFVEDVPKMAAELGERASPGQILLTIAVDDSLREEDRIDTVYLGLARVHDVSMPVYEVARAAGSSRDAG